MASELFPNIVRVNRLMWLGLATAGLGVVAIVSPFVTGAATVIVLGVILLAVGLGQLHSAYSSESGGARFLEIIQGAITTLSAVLVIAHPVFGLKFLTLLLIMYFVADGIWKFIKGMQYISAPGWLWIIASGALSLLLAVMLWKNWPVSGEWVVGTLIGVNLLSTGLSLVAFSRSIKASLQRIL